jgi:hypothetical protein
MRTRLLPAACVLSLSSPVFAATVLHRTDADLIRLSDRVVRARAIDVRTEREGRTIYTVTTMAVLEDFTGGTATRIEVRELGGIVGNEFLYVAGAVQYVVGEEVVLCLERGPRGLRALGMNLGKFVVERRAGDDANLRRTLDQTAIAGGSVARAAAARSLNGFRRLAREVRRTRARQFQASAPLTPEGPVVSPFSLLTIGGLPVRWVEADAGIPVRWFKNTAAPNPLAAGDASGEIQTALAAWTNPPTASIVLQYGGTTHQPDPMTFTGLPTPAGVISFEDPSGEISGSTLAIGGGFGFVGGGGTIHGQPFSRFDHAFVIFQNAADLDASFRESRDFTRVLQHEVGHGIGFGHTATDGSVANPTANIMYPLCCLDETPLPPNLGADDLSALAFVYPAPAAACTYSITPSSATVPAVPSSGSVSVSTQPGCAWTASSRASFLAIADGANGAGPGTVTYTVAPNAAPTARSGTLTVAGRTFAVTQQARRATSDLDLNADGWLDLLWHHQGDGRISAWLMNGPTMIDGTLLTPSQVPDTNWKLQGTGDLDGDGHDDLVWQHVADGRVSAWLMNGLVQRQGTPLSTPEVADTQWRIRSVGDLSGDHKADLLWQHEGDGRISVWLMNGLTVIDARLLSPPQVPDLQWKIVGTADFDGNRSRDLVWHHQGDGRIAIWFMNGTLQISGAYANPGQVADVNWQIRAVGDLNGDGRPDLLWQNVADGRISVWLMNGLNLIEGTLLDPSEVPDTNWHIVGPR